MGHNYKDNYLILFDDECIMCNKFIQKLLSIDDKDKFYVSPLGKLQSENINKKTINVLYKGSFYVKSDAIILLLSVYFPYLKYANILPKFLRDFVYDIVANINAIIKRRNKTCTIPSSSIKSKYINDNELYKIKL